MLAIFLDIETTGLDPFRHKAIDLALKAIDMTTGDVKGEYQSLVKQPQEVWDQRDPASMKINGYVWDQVVLGKDPSQIRDEIIALFREWGIKRGKAVFICQNPAFDRGFFAHIIDVYTQEKLNWPYHWLDFASMYWALLAQKGMKEKTPFPQSLNLSKNEIAKLHHLPPEGTPHLAMNGVEHLISCYDAVIGLPKP
jgi:oligoribonuclease